MGLFREGSLPVQSPGSLIFFQFLRCRNLGLNRVFSYFLRGRHIFILWGVCMLLTFINPLYISTPLHIIMPPKGEHMPHISCMLLCICMFPQTYACCWELKGPSLHVGHFSHTSPCMGVSPLQFTPPIIHWLPCALVCFRNICMSYGDYSLMWGVWEMFPPSVGDSRGITR